MSRLSVRARLTLWNVGVVALLMVTLGLSVRAIVHAILIDGIDSDLAKRMERPLFWTSRRIHYESGEFVYERENWGDNDDLPHRFLLDGSAMQYQPLFEKRFNPERPDRPGGDKPDKQEKSDNNLRDELNRLIPPTPPALDVRRFRVLRASGDLALPFYSTAAWDKAGVLTAAKTRKLDYRTITADGQPYRIITMPVRIPKDKGGTTYYEEVPLFIQMAFRLTDIERGLSALDRALLTLLPLSLLVAGVSGAIITGRALRPVRAITLATDKIAAESLSGRLPVTGHDEFSELARRFNSMLERLEGSFDRQKRFVADASHELRTPLAIVTANTSLALDDETPPTTEGARRSFVAIHGAAQRMSRITNDLLLLAQSDSGPLPREHKSVSLAQVLDTAAEEAKAAFKERTGNAGAELLPAPATDAVVPDADAHHLVRVFVNLLDNALRHTPETGKVSLSVQQNKNAVHVAVADTGSGIAPEHLPRLFDPFYRVDDGRQRARGGTGLGLAIVQALVQAHNGSISVDSELGRGTVVSVTLPSTP